MIIYDNGTPREMTAAEQAEYETYSAQVTAAAEQTAAEQTARENARTSALAKLAALGLTDAEIAALVGA